jgi:hypothetical protein
VSLPTDRERAGLVVTTFLGLGALVLMHHWTGAVLAVAAVVAMLHYSNPKR